MDRMAQRHRRLNDYVHPFPGHVDVERQRAGIGRVIVVYAQQRRVGIVHLERRAGEIPAVDLRGAVLRDDEVFAYGFADSADVLG